VVIDPQSNPQFACHAETAGQESFMAAIFDNGTIRRRFNSYGKLVCLRPTLQVAVR